MVFYMRSSWCEMWVFHAWKWKMLSLDYDNFLVFSSILPFYFDFFLSYFCCCCLFCRFGFSASSVKPKVSLLSTVLLSDTFPGCLHTAHTTVLQVFLYLNTFMGQQQLIRSAVHSVPFSLYFYCSFGCTMFTIQWNWNENCLVNWTFCTLYGWFFGL